MDVQLPVKCSTAKKWMSKISYCFDAIVGISILAVIIAFISILVISSIVAMIDPVTAILVINPDTLQLTPFKISAMRVFGALVLVFSFVAIYGFCNIVGINFTCIKDEP